MDLNKYWLIQKANDFFNGFSNSKDGWSGKKIIIFGCANTCLFYPVVRWSNWAYNKGDWSLLVPILTIIVAFISALVAGNVWDKKINPTETQSKPAPTPETKEGEK
jgi:hypothetical protein